MEEVLRAMNSKQNFVIYDDFHRAYLYVTQVVDPNYAESSFQVFSITSYFYETLLTAMQSTIEQLIVIAEGYWRVKRKILYVDLHHVYRKFF